MISDNETEVRQLLTAQLPSMTVRPIRPSDLSLICEMHHRLSADSVYYRYLQTKVPALNELEAVCRLPPEQGCALVVTVKPDSEKIIALAYYIREVVASHTTDLHPGAEVAILVEDRFQGQGVGKLLWRAIHQQAQANQIQYLRVLFDPMNYRMMRLIKGSSFPYQASTEGNLNDFRVLLTELPQMSWVQRVLETFGLPTLRQIFRHQATLSTEDSGPHGV